MTDPVTEPVQEPTAPITQDTPAPATEPTSPDTPVAQETPGQDTPATPETPSTPETPTAVTEDIQLDGFKFDGQDCTVTIPADLANFTAEKGIDAQEIAKEMYSETGLTDETREKLYDAFGKWQVDTYLNGLEAQNKATFTQHNTEQEAITKAQEEAWEETMTLMGGEDKWADLDAYAVQNLDEQQLEEFNHVMQNGSLYMQKLMIADLWSKYQAAGAPPAPAQLDLETGSDAPPSNAGGAITQEEYFASFKNGEYRKDPAGWDARRQAGLKKGI